MKKFSYFLVFFSVAFLSIMTMAQTNFWERINSPINSCCYKVLAINENGTIFLGTDYGIFRSSDGGINWISANSDLSAYTFAFNSLGHIFALGSNGSGYGEVFRSRNDGTSWTLIYDRAPVKTIAINDSGLIFIGWGTEIRGTVERSTDNGTNWVNTELNVNSYAIDINANGTIFSGGWFPSGGCVFRSTDNGANWTNTNIGLSYSNVVSKLKISPVGHIFVGTSENDVYRSTDNGEHWDKCNISIFMSSLAINSIGHIFAGTYNNGVYRSTDDGISWTTVNTGLTNDTVISIAINNDGTLFAATNNGLFRSVQSTTSVKDLPTDSPIRFTLNQNYPNPFNPSTTIGYVLREKSITKLTLINTIGEEIAVLVNEEQDKGYHKIDFDSGSLSSGIYFYRLQTESFSETKKMILLK